MTSRRKSAIHRPPLTYADIKENKPIENDKIKHRMIACEKCKRGTGTLLKVEKDNIAYYYHVDCK
jgi:hypothetical protein